MIATTTKLNYVHEKSLEPVQRVMYDPEVEELEDNIIYMLTSSKSK
jgi:hypothetical protein